MAGQALGECRTGRGGGKDSGAGARAAPTYDARPSRGGSMADAQQTEALVAAFRTDHDRVKREV
ncbi:MAG: hypothetical protein ACKOEP_11605, partial [Phycisphaerales bacterium]